MIKLMFGLLLISIISLEVTVVTLLIRGKKQDKKIENLEEQTELLDKNTVVFTKTINTLHERVLKLERKINNK